MSIQVSPVDPEGMLLEEIADKGLRQYDVALAYAMALRSPDKVDWLKVNQAIIERWSMAGLRQIKKDAWKRVS